MTPAHVKDRNPDWKLLTGVAGAIATATAALVALGFQVTNPREQLGLYAAEQTKITHRIESQLQDQSRRIDSIAVVLERVNSLVQVKCIETTNRLVRQMLECRP